jgi:hypothetical protein
MDHREAIHFAPNRELKLEQIRPHVAMFMEPHATDWHLIELVVRNFGENAAYDIRFAFVNPPTVGQYENEHDRLVNVGELALPSTIPALAPGQEWRTIWDSTLSRAELGGSIEWQFVGTVEYADQPTIEGKRRTVKGRHEYQTKVVLDWGDLQPVQARRVDDRARTGKARAELAGVAAQPADVLPLRESRDAHGGLPGRDRRGETGHRCGEGPVADAAVGGFDRRADASVQPRLTVRAQEQRRWAASQHRTRMTLLRR